MAANRPASQRGATVRTDDSAFQVQVGVDHRYGVEIEPGLLARYGTFFVDRFGEADAVVLTDIRVSKLYGRTLLDSFRAVDLEPPVLEVRQGEVSKSMRTFRQLLQRLAEVGTDRRSVLVCLGGGSSPTSAASSRRHTCAAFATSTCPPR